MMRASYGRGRGLLAAALVLYDQGGRHPHRVLALDCGGQHAPGDAQDDVPARPCTSSRA
jgi:hypothetical protein